MQNRWIAAVPLSLALCASARAGEVRRHAKPIQGSYIVVLLDEVARSSTDRSSLRPSVREVAQAIADLPGLGRTTRVFEHGLHGFALHTSEAGARALADDGRVAWVEEDGRVQAAETRACASWGLDRIDQRDLPLSDTYSTGATGAGVHAYLLDTGVRATHTQIAGRVSDGYSALSDGRGTNDCNGHGTHVAAIVGGRTFGVATQVTIHPVRVLGCDARGTISDAIAGVDWVTAHHVAPAVANISLASDDASSALDAAVARSIASGVTYTVAAGNNAGDACSSSPARTAAAITVAASTSGDARAEFSNYGSCVDLFAPGAGITSAWATSDTASAVLDGTSMASPYVAGAVALYLQLHPDAPPQAVAAAIAAGATPDRISAPGAGTPNLLLYSLLEGGTQGQTTAPGSQQGRRPAAGPQRGRAAPRGTVQAE